MLMERALLLMLVVVANCLAGASSHAGLVLLANKGEQTLGIIDTITNQLVATIAESALPVTRSWHHPMGSWRLFRFTETLGSGEPRSKEFEPAFNAVVGGTAVRRNVFLRLDLRVTCINLRK